jgi:murein L,D-transpeptidase YcbB/YkuD
MQTLKNYTPWLAVLAFCYALSASADERAFAEQLRERIEAVAVDMPLIVDHRPVYAQQALIQHYTAHLFKPVWSKNGRLSPQALQLIEALSHAESQGLDADNYHTATVARHLQTLQGSLDSNERIKILVDMDLLLSDAFLTYSTHMLQGRVNPETLTSKWEIPRQTFNILCSLDDAVSKDCIDEALDNLTPKHQGYRLLLKALADYRQIKAQGGWGRIASGPKLALGNVGTRVVQLRKRLAATSDLEPEPDADVDSTLFDAPLKEAVKLFQQRHGLADDGVVGAQTLAALDVSIEARIEQLLVNLERWRWLPSDLGGRYILVNIAGFELYFVEDNKVVLKMPVVSGKMTYVVINPSWHVPTSIAVKDKLPVLRKNPDYLQQHNMKLYRGWGANAEEIDPLSVDWRKLNEHHFPYHIVQQPGPDNALGKIKFMFPNKYNVYLHDTSEPWLFKKTERSFSSGCIRVGKPFVLADYVLENNTRLKKTAIPDLFKQSEKKTLSLKHAIPVHVLYWTAWVDDSGKLNFRKDIYGRDRELAKALQSLPGEISSRIQPGLVKAQSAPSYTALDDTIENKLNR